MTLLMGLQRNCPIWFLAMQHISRGELLPLYLPSVRVISLAWPRLFYTSLVWDSSHETSLVAGVYEQTYTPDLQDEELASLQ